MLLDINTGLSVSLAGSCRDPSTLHPALRRAGLLDWVLRLPAPAAAARSSILAASLAARNAAAPGTALAAAAAAAEGYDAADLQARMHP